MGFLARLTTYIAGTVPRIKAADLNAMQDAIAEIIGGAITLKTLHVKYGDPNNTAAPGNFGLYVQTAGGHGGIRAESDSWLGSLAIGQYPTIRSQLTESKLRFLDTAASGGNPSKTTPVPNAMPALLVPKAWCYFRTDGAGGVTYEDGAAISALTIHSALELEVTFATAFDNDKYCAMVGMANTPGGGVEAFVASGNRWADKCRVTYGANLSNTIVESSLLFFGRQTT